DSDAVPSALQRAAGNDDGELGGPIKRSDLLGGEMQAGIEVANLCCKLCSERLGIKRRDRCNRALASLEAFEERRHVAPERAPDCCTCNGDAIDHAHPSARFGLPRTIAALLPD